MTDPNPKTLPRIEDKLHVKDLKAEAAARGIAVKSSMSKQNLIQLLGLGSIRMSATSEYKRIEKLRQLMENEKQCQIVAQAEATKKAYAIAEKANEKKEKVKQAKQHILDESNLDACPLASSNKLIAPQYKDNFAGERKDGFVSIDAKRKKKDQEEMERDHKRLRKSEEKEEKEQKIRKTKELEKKTGKLLPKHKVLPKENRNPVGLGYTVWSASGDCWNVPPSKQFDSSWKSLDDAKKRAKYVFYVNNSWGWDVSDVVNEFDTNSHYEDAHDERPRGLFNLQVHDEEGDEWTVSVVPDDAFKFLYHVDAEPNHHDDNDTESVGSDAVCL